MGYPVAPDLESILSALVKIDFEQVATNYSKIPVEVFSEDACMERILEG